MDAIVLYQRENDGSVTVACHIADFSETQDVAKQGFSREEPEFSKLITLWCIMKHPQTKSLLLEVTRK